MLQIFPHILTRIAGDTYDKLSSINFDILNERIDEIIYIRKELFTMRSNLCDSIYNIIPKLNNTSDQNIILNIKRDVFNNRKLTQQKILNFNSLVNNINGFSIIKSLETYLLKDKELENKILESNLYYDSNINGLRKNLKEILNFKGLKNGLLLSSDSLKKSFEIYLSKEPDDFKKREYLTEISLIKYVSRMYTKTSPFSSFTNLSFANLVDNPQNKTLQVKNTDTPQVFNVIRLNNYLFEFLKVLLFKIPEIFKSFHIVANPSIILKDNAYYFLINSKNLESFQIISEDEAISIILELVQENIKGLQIDDLVNELIDNNYIDAEKDTIIQYISTLIEIGFLEFNLFVSGIDTDWDIRLIEYIQDIGSTSELLKELCVILKMLRSLCLKYSTSDFSQREEILINMFNTYKDYCLKLQIAAKIPENERGYTSQILPEKLSETEAIKIDKEPEIEIFRNIQNTKFLFTKEKLIYEDSKTDLKVDINQESIVNLSYKINQLINTLSFTDVYIPEKNKMKQFFKASYGELSSISVLKFYEDYYREFKIPESNELKKRSKENMISINDSISKEQSKFSVKENVSMRNLIFNFSKVFRENIINKIDSETNEINISVDNILEAKKGLKFNETIKKSSVAIFAQLIEKNTNSNTNTTLETNHKWVINFLTPGFGKMFSRFLHLFDDKITEDIKEWNKLGIENTLLVENCDASVFNANIHPPLLDYEICIPGAESNKASNLKQMLIKDISIYLDEFTDELKLKENNSGKEIKIFDLGFQGKAGRSNLFQLLDNFSIFKYPNYGILTNEINQIYYEREKENGQKLIVLPRILFEEIIILQRKAWIISKVIIPLKNPKETNSEYFLKINEWRKSIELPDEVFIHLTNQYHFDNKSEAEMTGENIPKKSKLSRDDYKPQFIDFRNPFLINLFYKSIEKIEYSIKIIEMLPSSNDLVKVTENKYVTEFIIQYYDK